MKTFKKILSVVLLAALALSLSSCLPLDDAKERHMKYTDETHEEISFNGKIYKKLPYSKYGTKLDYYRTEIYYNLTENDVPVLLSDMYGLFADYSPDLDLIIAESSLTTPSGYMENVNAYFTTEENYEKYSEERKDPDLSSVAVVKSEFDPEDYYSYKGSEFIIIPEKIVSMLTSDIESGDVLKGDKASGIIEKHKEYQTFFMCTSDGLAVSPYMLFLIGSGDAYYIYDPGRRGTEVTEITSETFEALKPYFGNADYFHYD